MLAEIRRFYEELNKFWTEEICRVVEALKMCRIDPKDVERWDSFHSSLKQTIEFWKVCFFLFYYVFLNRSKHTCAQNQALSSDARTLRRINVSSPTVCPYSRPLWRPFRLTAYRELISGR